MLAMTHLPLTSAELGYKRMLLIATSTISLLLPSHMIIHLLLFQLPLILPQLLHLIHRHLVTPIPRRPLTPPTADPHHVDLPTIFYHEIPVPCPGVGTSRLHTCSDTRAPIGHLSAGYLSPHMSESDPYHLCHHPTFTSDDVTLSFQLQFQVLSRRVSELERFRDSVPPPPPACPPPTIPPPPSSLPPPSPPRPHTSLEARVLTLEQRANLSDTRMSHVLDDMDHIHSLVVPAPPPSPLAPLTLLFTGTFCVGVPDPLLCMDEDRV
ncbi:hypothetical protein Hanom_Chr10g00897041 [Helianthus anomalus]